MSAFRAFSPFIDRGDVHEMRENAMSSHRFLRVAGAAVAAVVLAASMGAPRAEATDYTWEGNVDEFWGTPGNWLPAPGGVPAAGDTVIFDDTALGIPEAATSINLGAGAAAKTVSFQHTLGHFGNYTLLGGATLTVGEGLGMPGVIEQAVGSGPVADNVIASDLMDAGDGLTVDLQVGTFTLSGRIGDAGHTVNLAALIGAGSTLQITHSDPSKPNNFSTAFQVSGGATLVGKGNSLAGQPITLDNGTLVIQGGDPYMGTVTIFHADFEDSPLVTGNVTAADLNAGTPVGTWTVFTDGNSDINATSDPGSGNTKNLFADNGQYDFVGNFFEAGLLADGVTVNLDVLLRRQAGDANPHRVQGLDSNGLVLFDVKLEADGTAGQEDYRRVGYWDSGGTLVRVGNPGDLNRINSDTADPAQFETLTLDLSATTMDIKLDGLILAGGDDVGYRNAGLTDIKQIRITGMQNDSGMHYDDFVALTPGMVPADPKTTLTNPVTVKGASPINPTGQVTLGPATLHGNSTLTTVGGGHPEGDTLAFASTTIDDTTAGPVTLDNAVDLAGGPLTLGAVNNKTLVKTNTGKASFTTLWAPGGAATTATLDAGGGELEFTGRVGGPGAPVTLTGTSATGGKLTFTHADPGDPSNVTGGVTVGAGGTLSITSSGATSSLGDAAIALAGGQLDLNATGGLSLSHDVAVTADSAINSTGESISLDALSIDNGTTLAVTTAPGAFLGFAKTNFTNAQVGDVGFDMSSEIRLGALDDGDPGPHQGWRRRHPRGRGRQRRTGPPRRGEHPGARRRHGQRRPLEQERQHLSPRPPRRGRRRRPVGQERLHRHGHRRRGQPRRRHRRGRRQDPLPGHGRRLLLRVERDRQRRRRPDHLQRRPAGHGVARRPEHGPSGPRAERAAESGQHDGAGSGQRGRGRRAHATGD
ncbi:MAG: hypothetical protein AMK72_13505 [Planctomycetes bacterium SM23_25]|nr:MAG: hypothetical protein AMK72_13505 [Planctomycetes bacterium SM23_25]